MNHEAPSKKSKERREEACREREKIITRLDDEDEVLLANKLRHCGEILRLTCTCCGNTRSVEKGCKQKWCPVCVRKIAAVRSQKYALAAHLMQWPLFVTLTVPHTEPCELKALRWLRRGFGRLRRHKLWSRRVRGGIGGLEINSRSGAFHPHLHLLLDCEWLAWYTPKPQRGDPKKVITEKCQAASEELKIAWARALDLPSLRPEDFDLIYKVKRADATGITSEILKYSVKGSDLANSPRPIGPTIRALQCTRLVTSFGTLYGKKLVTDGTEKKARPCDQCGHSSWITDFEIASCPNQDGSAPRGH